MEKTGPTYNFWTIAWASSVVIIHARDGVESGKKRSPKALVDVLQLSTGDLTSLGGSYTQLPYVSWVIGPDPLIDGVVIKQIAARYGECANACSNVMIWHLSSLPCWGEASLQKNQGEVSRYSIYLNLIHWLGSSLVCCPTYPISLDEVFSTSLIRLRGTQPFDTVDKSSKLIYSIG